MTTDASLLTYAYLSAFGSGELIHMYLVVFQIMHQIFFRMFSDKNVISTYCI